MTDSGDLKHTPLQPGRGRMSVVGWTLLVALAAWLSWPAWTSVHVEAFSANLQSMAILLHAHGPSGLALADSAFPIATEYQYMSRSGLVDALQGLMSLTGHYGDGIFRALMLMSMAVYCWASVLVARRWSGEPYGALVAVLLLTPGLMEISFYYADNLPSAALAMLALALIQREGTSALRWLAVGALFMAAILIRADAALVASALGLFLLRERKRVPQMLGHAVCLAVGAGCVLLLAQWLTPFRLLDSVHVVSLFNTLHVDSRAHRREAVVAAGFFGLITPMLLLFGLGRNVRARSWHWHLGWTVLPALFYLYALPRALELRMFLLLGAPALLVHQATGLRVLRDLWASRRAPFRWIAVTVAVLCLGVMCGPAVVRMRDGPRTLIGRIYSPLIWREWQQSVTRGMQQLDSFAGSVRPGETVVVVSSQFNVDHYLRLRLLLNGYDLVPFSTVADGCPGMNEVFRKGDRTVIHVRSEVAYGIPQEWAHMPNTYTQAFEIAEEIKCLASTPYQRAVLANWEELPDFFLPALDSAPEMRPPWDRSYPGRHIPALWRAKFGELNIQPWTPAQMHLLEQSAENAAAGAERTAHGWKPLSSYAELHRMYAWRFGTAGTNKQEIGK